MSKTRTVQILMMAGLLAIAAPAVGQQVSPAADTFVYGFLPDWNFGGQNQLGLTSSAGHEVETLVLFNLPAINAEDVVSATLHFYSVDPGHGTEPAVGDALAAQARAVLGAWNEMTVTWATMPAVDTALEGTAQVTGWEQWFSINVTHLVKDWLDGSLANNGVHLSTPSAPSIGMYAREAASNQPYLEIQTGSQPAWGAAQSAEATTVGGAPAHGSGILNSLAVLMVPLGAVVVWRRIRRK